MAEIRARNAVETEGDRNRVADLPPDWDTRGGPTSLEGE